MTSSQLTFTNHGRKFGLNATAIMCFLISKVSYLKLKKPKNHDFCWLFPKKMPKFRRNLPKFAEITGKKPIELIFLTDYIAVINHSVSRSPKYRKKTTFTLKMLCSSFVWPFFDDKIFRPLENSCFLNHSLQCVLVPIISPLNH